jgi:hypothetical protein
MFAQAILLKVSKIDRNEPREGKIVFHVKMPGGATRFVEGSNSSGNKHQGGGAGTRLRIKF